MPKKRVGVSLRKPSPAPDSAAPGAEVHPVHPVSAPSDAPATHGNAALELDTLAREALPAPLEPRSVDAFVNGAAAALHQAATEIPAAQLRDLLQRGPLGYRELTLYLPEELARELSLHCLEHDLDMNRLVADALRQHLSLAPVPARRASDVPPSDGSLSLAARALLIELGEWVRESWASRRRALTARLEARIAAL